MPLSISPCFMTVSPLEQNINYNSAVGRQGKKNWKRSHVYFFIKASQLVNNSSHENEHPSTKKKLKPFRVLLQFSEVIIKRNLMKKGTNQRECTARVPAHFQCQIARFSRWIWRFLAADWYEVKCWSATPDSLGNSSPPHKYHNMWNCSGSSVQLHKCRSYMCAGTEQYK